MVIYYNIHNYHLKYSIFFIYLIFIERHSVQTIAAHNNEILSCDWNKYEDHVVVTGSVDKTIKVWDLRNPRREVSMLSGHSLAVRRVKCSPHFGGVIASCS